MRRTQKWILPILIFVLVFCFAVPLSAEPASGFMVDEVGLLTPEELADLNEQAAAYASAYDCGIYGYIVADYTAYSGESVLEAAKTVYRDNSLGVGEHANGVLLLLSMAERDYALVIYGDEAQAAFPAAAQDDLSDTFLDDFGNDDWYVGFSDYIANAEEMQLMAASGESYESQEPESLMITVCLILFVPLGIAFMVCMILRRGMKTARQSVVADAYLMENGARIESREDRFTHVTEVRTKIPKNDNNNIGGGFSGKSGKF